MRRNMALFPTMQHLPFYMNSATGEVYLVTPLNDTFKDVFEVDAMIHSISGSSAPLHARVIFELDEITHKDRPYFDQDPITIDVLESATLGETLHQITPMSSGGGNGLVYAMLDQVPNETFLIEPKSGRITLAKQLDYERDKSYILTVRVTESR